MIDNIPAGTPLVAVMEFLKQYRLDAANVFKASLHIK
jgi:hypothetical protein